MELEHASIQKKETTLPKWILIISGLFALMEILVSVSMCISPESTIENVDHQAKGVDFLIQMWASRQFALGFIFAFATYKKSIPMLTIAYIFLLVMFVGCLLYTSDAADERSSVDLGGCRIIKKKIIQAHCGLH